jgi:hypothetical protein
MALPPVADGIAMCFSEMAALVCAASAQQRSVDRHVPSLRDI